MVLKSIEPEPKRYKDKNYRLSWRCVDAPVDLIKRINWESGEILRRTTDNLIDLNMPADIEILHSTQCTAKTHKIMHSASLVDNLNLIQRLSRF